MEGIEAVAEEDTDKGADVVTTLAGLSITGTVRDLTLEPIVTTTEERKKSSTPELGDPLVVTGEAKTDDPTATNDTVARRSMGDEEFKVKIVPKGTLRAETGRGCLWCVEL